ncbi:MULTISPECIES: hypothetical protein [Clostridium]|nr:MULTISPECIES: hypothetical protein [Clostridium]
MKHLFSKKIGEKGESIKGRGCIPCKGSCMFSCYGGNVIDIG